jgi:hypothetical protein
MTYTINGKEYTEFDINLRCAEIEGLELISDDVEVMAFDYLESLIAGEDKFEVYVPCTDWNDAGHIVDKCFDELTLDVGYDGEEPQHYSEVFGIKWNYIMKQHNCTKLVAACICYIDCNEGKL